jgi:hypothetical protein
MASIDEEGIEEEGKKRDEIQKGSVVRIESVLVFDTGLASVPPGRGLAGSAD